MIFVIKKTSDHNFCCDQTFGLKEKYLIKRFVQLIHRFEPYRGQSSILRLLE